ncbi:MAG: glycosyltransferase family 39 protein [Chloroflexota bacterium]
MAERLSNQNIERLYLPIIILVSVLLRLASAIYLGNGVTVLPGIYDQLSYHFLANRVIDGYGFTFADPWWPVTPAGEPTAHWSYLYTSYLIGVYSIFGRNPIVARVIQVLIVGVLHPYLTFQIGKKLFGHVAGMIAAAWVAVYVYFVYYTAALMTEPVYITAILISFYFAIQLSEKSDGYKWKTALFFGIALAVTVLFRQLFLLFTPIMFVWIWWSSGRKRIFELALASLIIVGSILPITAFNYSRFDQFVLVNTNAGFAFYWGNHPIHGTKFISILPTETYLELIPEELHTLSEAELEDELMSRAIEFIVDEPGRYVLLSLSRIPSYFMFWPSVHSSAISNLSRVMSFGVALPFTLVGLWMAIRRWDRDLSSPLVLVILFIAAYTGIHLLSWALVRYRLPLDSLFLMFSGLAVAEIFQRFVTGTETQTAIHYGTGE